MIHKAISLKTANEFVARLHRHHKPARGHKFSIGAFDGESLVGVVMVGRPVARNFDDGDTVEVNRLCTDGTKNACSFLYACAARAAKEIGYVSIITYILSSEPGTSLLAAGWILEATTPGGSWNCAKRPRTDSHPLEPKTRWRKVLRKVCVGSEIPANSESPSAGQ